MLCPASKQAKPCHANLRDESIDNVTDERLLCEGALVNQLDYIREHFSLVPIFAAIGGAPNDNTNETRFAALEAQAFNTHATVENAVYITKNQAS